MTFEVGDKVWLSTRHIQTMRSSKKLDYKRIGPFEISKVINRNAYRLERPHSMKIYNVFHASLFDQYVNPVPGQHPSEPQPAENLEEEGWKVERTTDSRKQFESCGIWCSGQTTITFEPAYNLENADRLVAEFHRQSPLKPKPSKLEV